MAALCDAFATFLIFWPIYSYRKQGQDKRLEQIRGFYAPDVIAEYFKVKARRFSLSAHG